jgi:zinc protease
MMARLRAFVIAAVALVALNVPVNATNIERVVSPGGIEFWFVRDATVPLVSVNFAFRGGAVQDPDDKLGLAEMTVATLDEGAGDLDSAAFQERLERYAIELQMRSSREHVRATLRTLKEHQGEAFNLLRLALNEPRFDTPAVERSRTQMLVQLQRQSTNPNAIASRNWWAAAFPSHPYGRPPNGTLEAVARITTDDMRDYVRRVLARDALKLAIVGDIDAADAGRLVDQAFGALPAKAQLKPLADASVQGLGSRTVATLNVPQTVLTFGGRGIHRNDPDFMAAYLVNHILGGGSFTSRLYREVREIRGLAYGVNTGLTWFEHGAVLLGGTATRAESAAETIELIEREFRRMAAEGPTEDELAKAKTYLKGSFALNLDTSSKIAAQLVQMQIDNLGIDYIDRRGALIDAVTLDDARRVAKRLLGDGLLFSVVGRPKVVPPKTPGG